MPFRGTDARPLPDPIRAHRDHRPGPLRRPEPGGGVRRTDDPRRQAVRVSRGAPGVGGRHLDVGPHARVARVGSGREPSVASGGAGGGGRRGRRPRARGRTCLSRPGRGRRGRRGVRRTVTLDELATRRVAVWGVGQEGRGVTRLLVERGASVVLVDDRLEAAERAALELDVPTRPITPDVFTDTDIEVLVRSPGVSRYRSEILDVERAGVEVTTAMAVWLEDFADARVLAVTGTKGKSTTAALAAAILAAS